MNTASKSSSRFKLLTIDEVLSQPDPEWLIDGILTESCLAQLWGESGVGKSFVALDMALSLAAGVPWLDRVPVRAGPVLYVAAEGHMGMKRRIAAWLQAHKLNPDELSDFRLLGEALPLAEPSDIRALVGLMLDASRDQPYALVVLDTQARCTAGLEENSAKEMGLVVEATEWIKRESGAAVLLVHHSGHERSRARGSSAVKAAIDTQMKVGPDGRMRLKLTCEKQKDWQRFEAISLKLIEAGQSLVAVSGDPRAPTRLRSRQESLTEPQAVALEALKRHETGLGATEWKQASGLKRSTFYKARKDLVEELNLVEQHDGVYSPTVVACGEASSEEVHRSTTPLRGGPLDPEGDPVEQAWEEASDESR